MNSYHYGNPEKQDWSHVADVFAAHESLNSERTSSLPLAQFWKEENLKDRVKNLETICPGITILPEGSELYFEYGISVPDGYGRGKASMTDLMIISKQHAIAIEAKYTEVAKRYETIRSWLKKSSKADDNNRDKVLNGWLKYISEANCFAANLKDSERQIQIKNVPYQLVHRIASACAVANRMNVSPAVIYQIFYDKETCIKAAKFATNLLHSWINDLGLKSDFKFYAIGVPTYYKPQKVTKLNSLFLKMKTDAIYTFGRPCNGLDISSATI